MLCTVIIVMQYCWILMPQWSMIMHSDHDDLTIVTVKHVDLNDRVMATWKEPLLYKSKKDSGDEVLYKCWVDILQSHNPTMIFFWQWCQYTMHKHCSEVTNGSIVMLYMQRCHSDSAVLMSFRYSYYTSDVTVMQWWCNNDIIVIGQWWHHRSTVVALDYAPAVLCFCFVWILVASHSALFSDILIKWPSLGWSIQWAIHAIGGQQPHWALCTKHTILYSAQSN